MKHSYFRSDQSDQFSFYRIPKVLFMDEQYKSISTDAKVLYGLLLDRMSLSQKNGWCDSEGRVFIVFTVEEITTALSGYTKGKDAGTLRIVVKRHGNEG